MTPRFTPGPTLLSKQLWPLARMTALPLLCTLALGLGSSQPSRAEGSREMVAGGQGNRPFTEWASTTTAGIPRQTLLHVYAREGETLNLGSSVASSANNPDDIVVYRAVLSPTGWSYPAGWTQTCDVASTGFGLIDTLAKETAGPLPNPGGYTPCTLSVPETGFYAVEFRAPATTGNPTPTSATATALASLNQASGVAAWDITVFSTSGTEQTGRVFTNYLALNMGGNGVNLASDFFIQTWDGYLYRTDMNDVDPFGFIFFGNSKGFLDTNGATLYRSARAPNNSLSPFLGGVVVQDPRNPNNPATNDYTHLVFFNPPDNETLAALGITPPITPQPPADFRFVGTNRSDNQSLLGTGGYFEFTVASGSSYRIILDINADGLFDVSTDLVFENSLVAGYNRVDWDGRDASGNAVPPRPGNVPYDARIIIRSGEYHFPMLDAEHNVSGFIIEMLNPPQVFPALLDSNGEQIGPSTIYYNDDNYVTANGTTVSLDGTGATSPRNASQGINSSSGEHEFSSSYGDFMGIDTWAYFPSDAVLSSVVITDSFTTTPGILLVKRITAINGQAITDQVDGINSPGGPNHVAPPQDQDDNHANWPGGFLLGHLRQDDLQPGDEVEFTIYALSSGDAVAQDALLCDLVPPHMTFVPDAYSSIPGASGPSPVPGVSTAGPRGIVLGLGTQSTTAPYPMLASLSNVSDGDVGQFVPAGVDLTTIDSRLSGCGANTNGAVVVNLGDLPPATNAGDPPGSYGFVRFRGRIQ